ncbi:MAG: hypothetical protein K0R88_729 [Solirubrobacterales bacterium]|nr:hypothetical protein [Solirubrobacterales bacterium]
MDGFFPIFFLMVILKIPVAALLYLVWWAFRASTEPEEAPPGPDGHRFGRFRRQPKRPRGPRRGGHGDGLPPLPACPPGGRARVLTPPAPIRASRRAVNARD